ncbi:MAG: hypothetical protein ACHQRJ_03475 [Alphaproteobacteria bacterium]
MPMRPHVRLKRRDAGSMLVLVVFVVDGGVLVLQRLMSVLVIVTVAAKPLDSRGAMR